MRDSKMCLDLRCRLNNCYPTMDSFKDILLKVIFSLYLVLQATETINANCSTQPYVNSKGLTCYPCSPGFRVYMECNINGTTNICAPCADDEYQPTCQKSAISCLKCSTCDQLPHQTISKTCTREHDTVCTCTEGKYWDTYEKICRSCPPGKHLAKGVNGENEQCVSCKPGTFSNRSSASECQPCRNCTDYKEVCTDTSDAECNQLSTSAKSTTTEKGTTMPTTNAKATTNINSDCSCKEKGITVSTTDAKNWEGQCKENNELSVAILVILSVFVGGVFIYKICHHRQKLSEWLPRHKTRAEKKEIDEVEKFIEAADKQETESIRSRCKTTADEIVEEHKLVIQQESSTQQDEILEKVGKILDSQQRLLMLYSEHNRDSDVYNSVSRRGPNALPPMHQTSL